MRPLVIRADISSIHIDVIAYGVGCFLAPGYLAASLKKRYGKNFHQYLRGKFNTSKPKRLSNNDKKINNEQIKKMGGLPQGFTHYIPATELCESLPAPHMILAVVGGEYHGHINAHSIRDLVENIGETLAANCKPNTTTRIAFPAFGLGKGRSQRIEVMTAQLQAMYELGEKYPHIHPIFISYSDIVYRMALTIYDSLPQNTRAFVTKYKMNNYVKELQYELQNERLVLFIGAGVSQSSGLPNWQSLVAQLATAAQINEQAQNVDEMLDLAAQCREKLGKYFTRELKRTLEKNNPTPSITHYLLATFPVGTIVTTNFDTLLEQSLLRIKKAAFTIHSAFDVAWAPMKDQVNILKIHGDIDTPHEITLSKEDYDHYFQRRPALSALLKGLFLNRTFLFVGYSLRDPNLNIILQEVGNLLKKAQRPIYMIVFEATEEEIISYKQQGVVVICVAGTSIEEKSTSLWQLLNCLQSNAFQAHNTWLAQDADELGLETAWQENINDLRSTLGNFIAKLENEEQLSDAVVDFLFPWLTLAMNNGLNIPSTLWEKIAHHYRQRDLQIEATKLNALVAEIAAFRSSDGKRQNRHEARIWEMRKNWHK
ncbi:SIR2 family protein [Candidatus Uabimicrobium amorphum]|uniref:Deacetylase sirtuin-type domain-containing protein n=1 Tax=Uabimicrobium amorphum TaxID=2596890 RepID=A0A5S9II06_UABAM|nr:SIR2 family protein [Candidatus Uabimicrobium amorphum]BBM82188.1 hypothetical protein UABAM_00531 [Candidatus Uabimicrobium amorphum]